MDLGERNAMRGDYSNCPALSPDDRALLDRVVANLPHPWFDAIGVPDPVADAIMAFLALVIVTSVSMVFGELVPKYLAVARPLGGGMVVLVPHAPDGFLCTARCFPAVVESLC